MVVGRKPVSNMLNMRAQNAAKSCGIHRENRESSHFQTTSDTGIELHSSVSEASMRDAGSIPDFEI
jgi:hypothetical protein